MGQCSSALKEDLKQELWGAPSDAWSLAGRGVGVSVGPFGPWRMSAAQEVSAEGCGLSPLVDGACGRGRRPHAAGTGGGRLCTEAFMHPLRSLVYCRGRQGAKEVAGRRR